MGTVDRRGQLASERVIINAPMSFAGAAQRSFRLRRASSQWVNWLLITPPVLVLVAAWWAFILCWYVVFGLLLSPYRILRRGARKRKKEALRHREMLSVIERDKRP